MLPMWRLAPLLAVSLVGLLLTTSACRKQEEGPSIKARGHTSGAGLAATGTSGQVKSGEITTDAAGRRFEDLEFMADGVTIRGTLVLPKRPDPAPAVVLVHMVSGDRTGWTDWQLLLADEGFASFAIDLRGHGQSEGGPSGHQQFSPKEWQAGVSDVRNAVLVLKEYPDKVNPERIAVMGASIGANYAIELGAEMSGLPVIAVSAGLNYRGVDVRDALTGLGRRAFLIGQMEDAPAEEFLMWAQEQVPEATVWREDGGAHGLALFPNGPLENQILVFLRDRMGIRPDDPGGELPGGIPPEPDFFQDFDDGSSSDSATEEPAFEEFPADDPADTPSDELPEDPGNDDDDALSPPSEDDFAGIEG